MKAKGRIVELGRQDEHTPVSYTHLEGYELLCRMFLRLPNAVVVTGKPEIWKIVIYYCLLFAFVMWWRRKIIEKKMEEKKGKWKKEVPVSYTHLESLWEIRYWLSMMKN